MNISTTVNAKTAVPALQSGEAGAGLLAENIAQAGHFAETLKSVGQHLQMGSAPMQPQFTPAGLPVQSPATVSQNLARESKLPAMAQPNLQPADEIIASIPRSAMDLQALLNESSLAGQEAQPFSTMVKEPGERNLANIAEQHDELADQPAPVIDLTLQQPVMATAEPSPGEEAQSSPEKSGEYAKENSDQNVAPLPGTFVNIADTAQVQLPPLGDNKATVADDSVIQPESDVKSKVDLTERKPGMPVAVKSDVLPSSPALEAHSGQVNAVAPAENKTGSEFQLDTKTAGAITKPETDSGSVAVMEIGIATVQKTSDTKIENVIIPKPISHPDWSRDLGDQILWLHNKDISAAEIRLNPQHLGSISIRIDIQENNQASVFFITQHAETKEALEASVPKLKEMLGGQQLNLVNVNISHNPHSQNNKQQGQSYDNLRSPGKSIEGFGNEDDLKTVDVKVNKGLLSLYA